MLDKYFVLYYDSYVNSVDKKYNIVSHRAEDRRTFQLVSALFTTSAQFYKEGSSCKRLLPFFIASNRGVVEGMRLTIVYKMQAYPMRKQTLQIRYWSTPFNSMTIDRRQCIGIVQVSNPATPFNLTNSCSYLAKTVRIWGQELFSPFRSLTGTKEDTAIRLSNACMNRPLVNLSKLPTKWIVQVMDNILNRISIQKGKNLVICCK